MAYETIIVPPVRTMRSTTLKLLEEFASEGGKLIFLGDCPDYVDAEPSDAAGGLYEKGIHCGLLDPAILSLLESERFLEIQQQDGRREEGLLHQIRREENGDMWLFICNGRNPASPDVDPGRRLRFTLKGDFAVTLYDTMTGNIVPVPVRHEKGRTILERSWYIHESMLLYLREGKSGKGIPDDPGAARPALQKPAEDGMQSGETDILPGEVSVVLQEPNLLLLDLAEYALDDGDYHSEDELLRIDNHARQELGIPLRRKEVVQPYLLEEEETSHVLHLRFRIRSEMSAIGLKLRLE